MRHLATYLLLVAGGNSSPTAEDVTNALSEVGVEVDTERLNLLISEMSGKNPEELMAAGKDMLVKMGGGGGGGAAPAAAAAGGAPAAAAPAEKPKVEEVDALEGGMDMFGGGGSDY
mmetsp:Transcript_3193/g.4316  ORF Transcript_3193/g.4316 Transcript_3193/m.4316 type:complete len:116 (-) Transcript_3193:65-412(-)|eukprot:CAMPEP_0116934716 /NCGR_PEP_ID=MMETSP0467-20121206/29831_1 /TAXON_ID=283647 /ORGANISM="Mesodinium pulex, Strain SPMC105" /LENGTH=115 /DNA_ID=CAMNT_0004615907 /DNA_START=60 /DNA_END=407 /DNA_ORIENTATION=+